MAMPIIDKDSLKEPVNLTLQYAIGLGYQFLAATAVFVGLGYYADQRRGGGSAFTLLGVGITFLYGGYEVWKLVRMMAREEEEKKQRASRTQPPAAPPSGHDPAP